MKSIIVLGFPWLGGGSTRVMQMQLRHIRDIGYRAIFAAVPSGYESGSDESSWRDFQRNSHELGADEVVTSGFDSPGSLRGFVEAARAWKNGRNAMHWALTPAHLAVASPRLKAILAEGTVRFILANHVYTMPFALKLQSLLAPQGRKVPLLVVTHDVQSHILLDRNARAPWKFRIEPEVSLLKTELEWLTHSDALIHVSHDDLVFFKQLLPEHRHHLMLPALPAMDLGSFCNMEVPKCDLFYVGDNHVGNIKSLSWYFRNVVPHFVGRPPSLTVAGRICDAKEDFVPHNFMPPWLDLVGQVDDVRPYYAGAKAALGATTNGRGISIKTIEAFSAGLPVAGTDWAFRGIPKEELMKFEIRSENDSCDFARLVTSFLTGEKRDRAAHSSRSIYEALFTPARSAIAFHDVLAPFGM